MSSAEDMQYNIQLGALCERLGLGEMRSEPKPLTGGLLHRMFAVETSSGKYAVKALNPQVMLRPKAKGNILTGERIAANAARFIPALSAKQLDGEVMHELGGQHYLVYDWIEGTPLYGGSITASHCREIGNILGKIHSIDFRPLNIPLPASEEEAIVNWGEYLHKGKQADSPWAQELSENIDNLYDWNRRYLKAMKYLEGSQLIGHGDIDPKNVMWHDDKPVIIDWESAGYLNAAHEFIVYALYWADSNKRADRAKFDAFLEGYLSAARFDDVDWRTVMDAGLSPHWLEYSLKRSLGIESADAAEMQMGTDQVFGTIKYLKRYEAAIPQITQWLQVRFSIE